MAKINILDKTIFNRISAGEVVERPASVVKELVENSIDAGATKITVEILNGGISRIRVSDNGCGIEASEITKAFLPHSTSKICNIEDLEKIGTLGFRGEALCSICAVSKVTLVSKTADAECGMKIHGEGGEISDPMETYCTDGTNITVEDLFYCVPARAKFLKKPKQEESEITNYITRLILANPTIMIKYIADGKQVYTSPGTNLLDAIYSVYGKAMVDNCVEVSFEKDGIKGYGYISKPTFSKPNRTYQILIVNGRYVINQTVSTAVYKAYEPYLMKGCFPFYVLNINMPLDSVDVNVHPNKLDIKFENSNLIFVTVLNAISKLLYETSMIKKIDEEEEKDEILSRPLSLVTPITPVAPVTPIPRVYEKEQEISDEIKVVDIPSDDSQEIKDEQIELQKIRDDLSRFLTKSSDFGIASDNGLSDQLCRNVLNSQKLASEQENMDLDINDFKVVGVVFNTYIILEMGSNMYIIDQHAGHERVLYDKFKEQTEKSAVVSQPMIVPYIIDTNAVESQFIEDNMSIFESIGFKLEKFGINSYKIQEVPLLLKDINIEEFFNETLKDLHDNLITSKAEILKDYLAKSACRAAVKGNDILSDNELKYLVNLLKDTKVLLCPHGRPIVVTVSDKEIEKWFKRIV